jgi:hypothetical protein
VEEQVEPSVETMVEEPAEILVAVVVETLVEEPAEILAVAVVAASKYSQITQGCFAGEPPVSLMVVGFHHAEVL